ncbi:MAG: hypothetical protein V1936_04245 [Patescibacteria group bacterium]
MSPLVSSSFLNFGSSSRESGDIAVLNILIYSYVIIFSEKH